jgi:hypothetical protein
VRRVLVVLIAVLLHMQGGLRAQTPRPGNVFAGRVTQAGDTTVGVGGAELEIVGTGLRGYANDEGRFRFTDMESGSYELHVRRIGYLSSSVRIVVEDGRPLQRNVELRRFPNALTEVRIEGRLVKVPARFEEVYARAAKGDGTFFLRDDIKRLNPYDVRSLLNFVPTVRVNDRRITFARCDDMSSKVQVYIDGTRVTASPSTSPADAIALVHVAQIEAMEVYTGVTRIPAEFLNDACAVIAIWTKSY